VIRAAIVGTMLFAIALLTGMQISSNAVELVGLVTLALIVSLAAALFAAGIALRFRSIQAGPLMQTPVFLILFLAPVYVPFDLLQSWIQTAASINPITPIIEAVRGLIAGEPEKVPLAVGLGLGLVAAFMVWAVRGIRSAETAGG
jgi:ABC-2 type transport system permease protein